MILLVILSFVFGLVYFISIKKYSVKVDDYILSKYPLKEQNNHSNDLPIDDDIDIMDL